MFLEWSCTSDIYTYHSAHVIYAKSCNLYSLSCCLDVQSLNV